MTAAPAAIFATAEAHARAIRATLTCGRPGCPCRRPGTEGKTHCPSHDDAHPSLSVSVRDDRVLVRCGAGCGQDAVLDALRHRGLWIERRNGHHPTSARETRFELRDQDGQLVAIHHRLDLPDGHKLMWWMRPGGTRGLGDLRAADLPLYGIDRLDGAGEVIVTEGEKAAAALMALGIPAVGTVTGASSTPDDEALRPLLGRMVYLWPDNDPPGRGHMARIARRLIALGADAQKLFWIEWPEAPPGGDAADYVAGGHNAGDIEFLVWLAQPVTERLTGAAETGAEVEPEAGAPALERPGTAEGQLKCSSRSSQEELGRAGRAFSFSLAPLGALLAEPEEAVQWLVDGLLPTGGVSLLAAKPKVGKSTLARNLAWCVARGAPFLGRATAQGAVVYLALEEKRGEVARHFRKMGATADSEGAVGEAPLPVYVHVGAAPEEAMAALAAAVAAHRPALVIADPLLRLVRLRDANDYAEVTRALEPVVELARQSGAHLLLVHHLAKGERAGGDAILGSTALFGAVDTALLLRRHPDQSRTIESIQRYGEDLAESVLTLDEATGTVQLAGTVAERRQRDAEEAVLAVLSAQPAAELTEPEIREATEMKGLVVSQALRALVARGVVVRTGAGRKGDPFKYQYRRGAARDERDGGSDDGPGGTEVEVAGPGAAKCSSALPGNSWEEREEREEHFAHGGAVPADIDSAAGGLPEDGEARPAPGFGIVRPDGPCPRCGYQLVRRTCWKCRDSLCSDCGAWTGSGLRTRCIPCGIKADQQERWQGQSGGADGAAR
jgi:DNA repair protein RadA/Sms